MSGGGRGRAGGGRAGGGRCGRSAGGAVRTAAVLAGGRHLDSTDGEAQVDRDESGLHRDAMGTRFWMALEVNAGYFNEHGIAAGDRLEVDPLQHPPS